jgi:hypothetical protein
VTWTIVFVLAAGVWGQRFLGMYVGGPVLSRFPTLGRLAALIPAAVVTAVIVQLTVASGTALTLDGRLAGMTAAGLLVWRRAPFVVVVLAAAVVTAGVRALG